MWIRPDNQEVGLEAATLQRMRNSSLVEWVCAENVPGLKPSTEAAGVRLILTRYGSVVVAVEGVP